jgi:hypothetical protein
MSTPPPIQTKGKIVRADSFGGGMQKFGGLLIVFGIICSFGNEQGAVVGAGSLTFGVVLLLLGSVFPVRLICSVCGNRVEKTSKLCPHCRATLTRGFFS